MEKAYGHWAAIYDALCGPVFWPAHRAAANAANEVGGHVLEVGVGTGLILPRYGRHVRVTGLDISERMLAKARKRLRDEDMPHVSGLEVGDIHALAHAAQSYDAIVLPFVLTLLSAPETALDNCRRMLRPRGEIIIVSHFQSRTRWLAAAEAWLAPRVAALGLRPDFPVERIERWASGHSDLKLLPAEGVGALGVYTLLRIRKAALSTAAVM